jgi:hypothetical protein
MMVYSSPTPVYRIIASQNGVGGWQQLVPVGVSRPGRLAVAGKSKERIALSANISAPPS